MVFPEVAQKTLFMDMEKTTEFKKTVEKRGSISEPSKYTFRKAPFHVVVV